MSVPSNPGAAHGAAMAGGEALKDAAANAGRKGMTPRQAHLNHLWSYYTGNCYDARKVDWNGNEQLDPLEHEVVATAGYTPPGFVDNSGGSELPLKYRRPKSPYYLVRVVVKRKTGLLFSAKRHPKLRVPDDELTEDWLNAFCAATRLWARMISVRNYGGAMGAVAVGFKFVDGKPFVEVHDARWCEPKLDSDTNEVLRFEKRYMYPEIIRNEETGESIEGWFWYRRLITASIDEVWEKVPVDDGAEPRWKRIPSKKHEHNLGFVPVVWIKNTDVSDDIDGEPDCQGIYDQVQSIDELNSQSHRGCIANMDPTLKIKTDDDSVNGGVKKGSDNALIVGQGDDAGYMEIEGTGIELGMKLADRTRELALEVAQCVLDTNFDGPARSDKEVSGNFSSMLESADELREQYGEAGVKCLLSLVLRAARKLGAQRMERDAATGVTRIVTSFVKLPPKYIDGKPYARRLGTSDQIELVWPPYFETKLADGVPAVQAAAQAKTSGLVDSETATRAVAPYFGIEDVAKVVQAAKDEESTMSDTMREQVMNGQ